MNNEDTKITEFFSNPDFSEREGICFLLQLFTENPKLKSIYVANDVLLKIDVIDEAHDDKLDSVSSCLHGYCSKSCSLFKIEEHIHPVITEHGIAIMNYFGFKLREI
ncbi:hypothetical protein LMH73_007510 [Vibrio splendidus]|nr:hypothetical protein [Vibrio splendidus]MCC4880376.1 hypothetical protein [Vibrio splendidus]